MKIQLGDRGWRVQVLQERLKELGWLTQDEPDFGPATAQAVEDFQGSHGLVVDGVVGPQTWSRLFVPNPYSRDYINRMLFGGQEVFDFLDEVVAAVSVGEGGTFDTMNLDSDGEGLSFGILQWAQNPGSLYRMLKAMAEAHREKFVHILAADDLTLARELLEKTKEGGKELPLWTGDWPRRFFYAGRDLEFQKVQRQLARHDMLARLTDGYELYPEKYKPDGYIAQRALMIMADVGNQAGSGGLKRALAKAGQGPSQTEDAFILALGKYVEDIMASKYGDPNYGDTQGRHARICQNYSLERVNWPAIKAAVMGGERTIATG
jgi:hypothetical protein